MCTNKSIAFVETLHWGTARETISDLLTLQSYSAHLPMGQPMGWSVTQVKPHPFSASKVASTVASVAVIKHPHEKQFREERVYFGS